MTPGAEALEETSRNQKIELITPRSEESARLAQSRVSIIVAAGADDSIGVGGKMPWHISADLKRFKRLTLGSAIVMGRRTWESIGSRPLPGRRNIVISGQPAFIAEGAEVVGSLEDALTATLSEPKVFIIGGGRVYREAFPMVDTVELTRIEAEFPDADTFFPHLDPEEWRLAEAEPTAATPDGLRYRFETWKRK